MTNIRQIFDIEFVTNIRPMLDVGLETNMRPKCWFGRAVEIWRQDRFSWIIRIILSQTISAGGTWRRKTHNLELLKSLGEADAKEQNNLEISNKILIYL